MNDDYLILNVVENIENAENNPRTFYNPEDAMELSDFNFIKVFRLGKEEVVGVEEMIRPFMPQQHRTTALSIRRKLLASLRFFAGGCYQLDVGKNFSVGVSQPSVSRALNEVVAALNQPAILNQHIHFPNTIEELANARERYYNRYGFPGVVGCVDGSFVAIVAPIENEHIYINRKRYHSLNVQMVCDESLKILNVNARYPGSTHDSFIWQNSGVERFLRNLPMEHRGSFYVLGDSGYPLRPWCITPVIPQPAPNTPEAAFNDGQKSTRSVIEQCFGKLKSRFRCLLRHRTLHYCPETAGKIVNACAVLHNICIENNLPIYNDDYDNGGDEEVGENNADPYQERLNEPLLRNELLEGRRLRQRIIRNYFN